MKTEYLTPAGSADYLGLSMSYLAKLRMGTNPVPGPRYIRSGLKIIRYRRDDLDQWMQLRAVSGLENSGGRNYGRA